jgi:hypothetical protein
MGSKNFGLFDCSDWSKKIHGKDSLKKIFDNFKSEVYNISFSKKY